MNEMSFLLENIFKYILQNLMGIENGKLVYTY